jgi:hypothetical protein
MRLKIAVSVVQFRPWAPLDQALSVFWCLKIGFDV